MFRPDFAAMQVSAQLARERAQIALPMPSGAGEHRSFGALFNELRRDISSFIAEGADRKARPALPGATSLTLEGDAQRAQLQDQTEKVDRARQEAFIASIAPLARRAAERLGVEPELVAAHAALESGWGERPLRTGDRANTHNLFGIKAGGTWTGDVVHALTTEIEEGAASKRKEAFRRYPDLAHAFDDYASLLLDKSRYAGAVNVGGNAAAFAAGLVQGRYATDTLYAQKIVSLARQVREIGLPSALDVGAR